MISQVLLSLYHQKLLSNGFQVVDGQPLPPRGMGGFAAEEITKRCFKEAEQEYWHNEPIKKAEPLAHWHEHNPWNDHIFYVPIDELAECCFLLGQPVYQGMSGETQIYTKEHLLDNWRLYGSKLDGYVLTGKVVTAGIRFGPEPSQYLSPGFHTTKLHGLIRQEQQRRRKSA
jgi:hypothetical protein